MACLRTHEAVRGVQGRVYAGALLLSAIASLLIACSSSVQVTGDGTKGNGTQSTGTQTTDTTPPIITITAPTTGTSFTATSAAVTVAGTITDNSGLLQISWLNSLGGSGGTSIAGTASNWSFNIGLQVGANAITLIGADAAGNTAQGSIVINYSPPTPNSATLSWDANPAPDLSGYRVYYGTAPGTYIQPLGQGLSVGSVTTFTVTGLSSATRYYFAVTAYDTSNNESAFSNEVFKDFP